MAETEFSKPKTITSIYLMQNLIEIGAKRMCSMILTQPLLFQNSQMSHCKGVQFHPKYGRSICLFLFSLHLVIYFFSSCQCIFFYLLILVTPELEQVSLKFFFWFSLLQLFWTFISFLYFFFSRCSLPNDFRKLSFELLLFF